MMLLIGFLTYGFYIYNPTQTVIYIGLGLMGLVTTIKFLSAKKGYDLKERK